MFRAHPRSTADKPSFLSNTYRASPRFKELTLEPNTAALPLPAKRCQNIHNVAPRPAPVPLQMRPSRELISKIPMQLKRLRNTRRA
ncbi:hypothetical protein EVAR_5326_1 [Eumeta japonica]|uniref:Uncharacterized protein n=1 Tax=Eumeta variegata TaxID=151549 RepID=A0A4C1TM91_EUMVA|nr:hypothetical protein EVAR_5326_1 [Eumeta japonica]